jgi:putative spermidine/putrescine transport system ATP-binding protein
LPGGRQPIGSDANVPTAVAMIRPETIRVTEAGSAPLSGIIDSVSFIGDRQRLVVSGASDKLLTIDAPNTVQAKAGERIGLSISPDAVRLLPPEN